jgi:hypothetical protein
MILSSIARASRRPIPAASRRLPWNTIASVKPKRLMLSLLAAATVSGCATARDGATLASVAQTMGPPKAGQARIVVFRPPGYSGLFDSAWVIWLDDRPLGKIKPGTFAYVDRPVGRHQLSFISSNFPLPSRFDFDAGSGRTYVFRIELNDKGRMIAAGSAAGAAGLLITAAIGQASDDRGTYDFVPVDEATGSQVLAELRLAQPEN